MQKSATQAGRIRPKIQINFDMYRCFSSANKRVSGKHVDTETGSLRRDLPGSVFFVPIIGDGDEE